jgi:hypothetical protein
MVRIIFAVVLLAITSPAFAQQAAIDRISLALGQCIGNAEQRADEIAALRNQLTAAQARIKELEPKPATKD